MIIIRLKHLFLGLSFLGLASFCTASISHAQSGAGPASNSRTCPFGTELVGLASRNISRDKNEAHGTLLWLDRRDEMWLYRSGENEFLRKQFISIYHNYRFGSSGYPKNKKISKRLEKYADKNRGNGGRILPRPKGVPAGPPQSAIAWAEMTLSCRYDPQAKENQTPEKRASQIAVRDLCPMTRNDSVYLRRPKELLREREDKNRFNISIAILEWKHRGSALFKSPNRHGVTFPEWRLDEFRDFYSLSETKHISPPEGLYSSIASQMSDGPIAPVLSSPPDEMLQWAEDFLDCRVNKADWLAETAVRDEKIRVQKSKNRINSILFEASLKRESAEREAFKTVRGRWRKPTTENRPDNLVGTGVYFDTAICKAVRTDLERRETISADEQAWGDWYAFYGYDELCGYLPPTYKSWLPSRSNDSDYMSNTTSENADTSTDLSEYETPPETRRERSNRERYEENQRCSNPTAKGC